MHRALVVFCKLVIDDISIVIIANYVEEESSLKISKFKIM